MGKLQIDILGTSFTVSAKEDDEYLKKLLGYYKDICNTIQTAGKLRNQLQVSILAGITLVDELYKSKKETALYQNRINSNDEAEAERLTLSMIEKLDSALEDNGI